MLAIVRWKSFDVSAHVGIALACLKTGGDNGQRCAHKAFAPDLPDPQAGWSQADHRMHGPGAGAFPRIVDAVNTIPNALENERRTNTSGASSAPPPI